MRLRTILIIALLLGVSLLAGCETYPHRSANHNGTTHSLSPNYYHDHDVRHVSGHVRNDKRKFTPTALS